MPLRNFLRVLPVAAVAALILALTGAGTASAKSCSDSSFNGGYFAGMTVKKVSCKKGKSIARAHRAKRLDHGGKDGKYNGNVRGFSCTETKRVKTSTELNARVKCTDGSKRVSFFYQQNL